MESGCENSPAVLFISAVRGRGKSLAGQVGELGLEVLSAARCREARSVLRKRSGIEVVVVDVTLPDGNWCEILRWMVEHQLDARVVLVSTVSDASLWSEAVWRGAYDVLVEPFTAWEFCRSIEGALRNRFPHAGGTSQSHNPAGSSPKRGASGNHGRAERLLSSAKLPAVSPA